VIISSHDSEVIEGMDRQIVLQHGCLQSWIN
jgi:hypothetical protein